MHEAATDVYFGAAILRRQAVIHFGAGDLPAYLRGVVDAFAREPGGSRETGLNALRQARDPTFLARLKEVQGFGSDEAATLRTMTRVADAIDEVLAAP